MTQATELRELASLIRVNGGNVGIGPLTADPPHTLSLGQTNVAGAQTIRLAGNSNPKHEIQFREAGTGYGFTFRYAGDQADNKLHIVQHENDATGTEVMTFKRDSMEVGIGTASPDLLYEGLHIKSANPSLKIEGTATNSWEFIHLKQPNHDRLIGMRTTGNIVINSGTNLDANNMLVIDTAGKVGINVENPDHDLDVDGAIATRQVRHSIAPTLNLDFANSKQLDSRITFYRDSIATYYDNNGIIRYANVNVPRFDHDPITGESKGLLMEDARVNIVPDSTNFGTFSTSRCVKMSKYGVAPDGTFSALYIASDGSASSRVIHDFSIFTPAANSTYTVSCYAKSVGNDNSFSLELGSGANNINAFFNLSNGTVTNETVGGTMTSVDASIEDVGNGWYRCIAVAVHGASWNQSTNLAFYDQDNTDANSGILVWAPQIEAGTFATSYIPSDTRFTSRASNATYHDETGVLRTAPVNGSRHGYKYDGRKWVETGLILENAATNLFPQYTSGNKYRTTIVNNTSEVKSPDGGNSAMKLTPDDATAFNYTVFAIGNNSLNGSTMCGSIYAKAGTNRYLWMSVSNTNGTPSGEPNCTFDLQTGTVVRAGDVDIAEIEPVADGWYRCSVGHNIDGNGSSNQFVISIANTTGARTSADYLYLAFPQIESGTTVPTSYIYWDGSGTTTRSADVASSTAYTRKQDIGYLDNIEDWDSQEEGTFYTEHQVPYDIEDLSTNRRILERHNFQGTNVTSIIHNGGTDQINAGMYNNSNWQALMGVTSPYGVVDKNTVWKTAFAYKENDFAMSTQGSPVATDTSGSLTYNNTRLQLGNNSTETAALCGHLKLVKFYSERLSNAELVSLTENN